MNKILLLPLFGILMTGCFKKEDPWMLEPSSSKRTINSITMGNGYRTVAFFDFATNQFKTRDIFDWDLQMEASPNGYRILLNGGRSGLIYNTKQGDFGIQFTPTANTNWQYDNPRWNMDSTAIGEWMDDGLTYNDVYIIDRGSETQNRYKKFQLREVSASQYVIHHSNLDGTAERTSVVYKNPTRNFTYFNFDSETDLSDYEPSRDEWDIQFTRYRHVFEDHTPIIPYLVTGALLNPNNVAVYKDTATKFDDIDKIYALSLPLNTRTDYIGYDWKTYDFATESYKTNSHQTYIIRTHSGRFFKMRFIDFYDTQGLRGTPIFEFQEL